ncbi:hypothetical protein ACNPOQ_05715, partial [Pseudomonas shirazensis]
HRRQRNREHLFAQHSLKSLARLRGGWLQSGAAATLCIGIFNLYVKQPSDLHKQWVPVLNEMGIRRRPPYNCRHTYATICLMSGVNPAFIAQQLGHSVQMLLSTYARWLNSSSDWSELEKLKIGIKSVSAEKPAP